MEEECIPAYDLFEAQLGQGEPRWASKPDILEDLKIKARRLGLWNMFLGKDHGGLFSNIEYALMAEYLGKSPIASEVRCAVLIQHGSSVTCLTMHRRQITQLLILEIWSF